MSVVSLYSLHFDDASASIRVSENRMIQAANDMRETALSTREVILRSRAAMAEADRLLTRRWEQENVQRRDHSPVRGARLDQHASSPTLAIPAGASAT